jgi:hypothetical protein
MLIDQAYWKEASALGEVHRLLGHATLMVTVAFLRKKSALSDY